MQKLFILLSSLMSMHLIAGEKPIEQENLDTYYIYYSFKTLEYPVPFYHVIQPCEPCIQPLDPSGNHPTNQSHKIFPLSLFLIEEFYTNPQFTLIAKGPYTSYYTNNSEYTFQFSTETGKPIKEVIQEKLKLFEQKLFPDSEWFAWEEKNPPFKEYVINLLNAGIIEVDKKTFKYVHGPNSWVVKKQKEAAAIKLLEDKNNVVLDRVIANITRYTQLVEITYLISLQRH